MSTTNITIKPNNHRAHPCQNDKKIQLLNQLISQNAKLNIVVACSKDAQIIKDALEDSSVKVMEDKELVSESELSYEMLISYDLPIKAIVYMARLSKATQKALILLDSSEQKSLYPIEMLLGRAVKQEEVKGFEYEKEPEVETTAPRRFSKEKIKEVAKKRYEEKTQERKPSDKPKREYKRDDKKDFKKSDSSDKWAKKKKEPNKFLGYDDNGKAKFSGKSGERNHRYDGTPRDSYDAPQKVGRKISIQKRKPQ